MKRYGPYKVQEFGVNLPWGVRKKLKVDTGDLVVWIVDKEGNCTLKKAIVKIEY